MFCEKCGKQIEDFGKCPFCGQIQRSQIKYFEKICPYCGRITNKYEKSCSKCQHVLPKKNLGLLCGIIVLLSILTFILISCTASLLSPTQEQDTTIKNTTVNSEETLKKKKESIYYINLLGKLLVEAEECRINELHAVMEYLDNGKERTVYYLEEYTRNNEANLKALEKSSFSEINKINNKIYTEQIFEQVGQHIILWSAIQEDDTEKFSLGAAYFPNLAEIQKDLKQLAEYGGLTDEEFYREICPYGIKFGNIHKNDKLMPLNETDVLIWQAQETFCSKYAQWY